MENRIDFESRIKRELAGKAIEDDIKEYGELTAQIHDGAASRKKLRGSRMRALKYATTVACICAVAIGGMFLPFETIRAVAMNVVQHVFVLDRDNQVVEKPANMVFMAPERGYAVKKDDAAISGKMGMDISFPDALCDGFKLKGKSEWVGVNKTVDYEAYPELAEKVALAVNDETVFDSLKEYDPYRTAGGEYENAEGIRFGIYVNNMRISVPDTNAAIVEATDTTVCGFSGKWLKVSGLDNSEDLTVKTEKRFDGTALLWTTDTASYCISPTKDQTLTQDAAMKYAEAFMNCQK